MRQCSWAIFLVSSSGKLFSFIVISVLRLILIFSGLTSPFLLFYQIIIFISLTFINPKRSFIYIYLSSCKCTINCLQTHFYSHWMKRGSLPIYRCVETKKCVGAGISVALSYWATSQNGPRALPSAGHSSPFPTPFSIAMEHVGVWGWSL